MTLNLEKIFVDSTAYPERKRDEDETLKQYKSHVLVQELLRRGWHHVPEHVKTIHVEPGSQLLSWSWWKAQ